LMVMNKPEAKNLKKKRKKTEKVPLQPI